MKATSFLCFFFLTISVNAQHLQKYFSLGVTHHQKFEEAFYDLGDFRAYPGPLDVVIDQSINLSNVNAAFNLTYFFTPNFSLYCEARIQLDRFKALFYAESASVNHPFLHRTAISTIVFIPGIQVGPRFTLRKFFLKPGFRIFTSYNKSPDTNISSTHKHFKFRESLNDVNQTYYFSQSLSYSHLRTALALTAELGYSILPFLDVSIVYAQTQMYQSSISFYNTFMTQHANTQYSNANFFRINGTNKSAEFRITFTI